IRSILHTFNARIIRIEITSLREDIFFGNIVADQDGHEINIDSRPSDAIALAVRARVPIQVHESVMDAASIVPEKDVAEGAPGQRSRDRAASSPPAEVNSERLDVFKDFLDKLDLDNLNDTPPDKQT
ncbi:MAG: bifunctional nuclease family protein, partial [Phycisphaerales bacterium]|nr:bifunctional nuclease family protein [Phycisphaerales bacterium]